MVKCLETEREREREEEERTREAAGKTTIYTRGKQKFYGYEGS